MTRLFFLFSVLLSDWFVIIIFAWFLSKYGRSFFERFFVKKKRNFLKNEKDIFESYFGVE